MRLKPGTLAMTCLLAAMTSIGPLSTDIYVASLPHIGAAFGATTSAAQMTVTFYLIGFALGQVIYGPVSDAWGRRPTLIAGYGLFTAASLACLFAQSIDVLIVARVLQALGGAGPIILARAIVRDLYTGRAAARQFGLMAMIAGVMPVIAPVAGGFLQEWYGWRAAFVVMFAFGAIVGAIVLVLLPETNARAGQNPLTFANTIESYRIVLGNRAFRAYLGIQACSYNGIFGFISASSYVLQRVYGLGSSRFGLAFAMCSGCYVTATYVGSRLLAVRGIDGMIGLGVACQFAAGILQALALAFGPPTWLAVVAPYMLFFTGVGFLLPQSQAASLAPFPERAGAASSMMGFIQMTSGAIIGTIVGAALGATAWPLATVTLLAGSLGFAIFQATIEIRRQGAPVTQSFPRP